jgi:hypothetical protein
MYTPISGYPDIRVFESIYVFVMVSIVCASRWPPRAECPNQIQLEKCCLHVTSNLDRADSEIHSWIWFGTIKKHVFQNEQQVAQRLTGTTVWEYFHNGGVLPQCGRTPSRRNPTVWEFVLCLLFFYINVERVQTGKAR